MVDSVAESIRSALGNDAVGVSIVISPEAAISRAELRLQARAMELEAELIGVKRQLGRTQSVIDSALEYAIITLDLAGYITGWNAGAQRIIGYCEIEVVGRSADVLFTLEDRQKGRLATEMARALTDGRATNERWHLKRNGSRYWASGLMMPLFKADGSLEGFLNILRDCTDEQAALERRELLLAEVNHRIKNMFTVVHAIASRTLRHAHSIEAFQAAFFGRLRALARSQDVLIRGNWAEAPLNEVIQSALGGFEQAGRIALEGPTLKLSPESVLSASLAFHELATNAIKYGAWSVPGGHIEISWSAKEAAGDAEKAIVVWREQNGPPVSTPKHRGFGSQLLERGIPEGGKVELNFLPKGLECRIDLPLSRGDQPLA